MQCGFELYKIRLYLNFNTVETKAKLNNTYLYSKRNKIKFLCRFAFKLLPLPTLKNKHES